MVWDFLRKAFGLEPKGVEVNTRRLHKLLTEYHNIPINHSFLRKMPKEKLVQIMGVAVAAQANGIKLGEAIIQHTGGKKFEDVLLEPAWLKKIHEKELKKKEEKVIDKIETRASRRARRINIERL